MCSHLPSPPGRKKELKEPEGDCVPRRDLRFSKRACIEPSVLVSRDRVFESYSRTHSMLTVFAAPSSVVTRLP